jgi:hypothetical protein
MSRDYIPQGIAEFTQYIDNAYKRASKNLTLYGLPASALVEITTALGRYTTAEAVATNPDTATTGARRERNAARKDLEKKWRQFINTNIRYNALVPEADREVFKLKPEDPPTPVQPPKSTGRASIHRIGELQFELRVLDVETGKFKLPKNASGSYVYLAITEPDIMPAHDNDFRKLDFSSTAHHQIDFPREQLGKQANVYVRYSNVHGKEGPKGPIETFIIG